MSDRLPRPRADLETFRASGAQPVTANVKVNANEWADPNPAGQYLTPQELDDILLNRYPSAAAAADLRATLAKRYGIKPEQLIFGNGSNDVLLQVFFVLDRKSTRLNSSHRCISYAVFCLKKKNTY